MLFFMLVWCFGYINGYVNMQMQSKHPLHKQSRTIVLAMEGRHLGRKYYRVREGNWWVVSEGLKIPGEGNLLVESRKPLASLSIIQCSLKLLKIEDKGFQAYLAASGYRFRCKNSHLIETSGPTSTSSFFSGTLRHPGIIRAIIRGERWAIDKSTGELYRRAGIAHILAISGFHMYVLYLACRYVFALTGILFMRLSRQKSITNRNLLYGASLLSLFVCAAYLAGTGYPVSATRAFILLLVFITAELVAIPVNTLEVLALAGLLILAFHPMELYSVSFQLSFAAFAGIICFFNLKKRLHILKKAGVLSRIFTLTGVSAFAILFTIPFTAYHFNRVNFTGMITNIVALPFFTAAIPVAMAGNAMGGSNLPGHILLQFADAIIGTVTVVIKYIIEILPDMSFAVHLNPLFTGIAALLILKSLRASWSTSVLSGIFITYILFPL